MTKKILFFIAGKVPTVAEQAQIDALNALTTPGYSVGVRNGAENASFGHGIETCDFVAGTIPTAYNAKTNYGEANAARPSKFALLPATANVAALATQQLQALKANGEANAARPSKFALLPATANVAALATQQLQALKANGVDISALTLADVTAVTTTYASSDAAKATVSAGGLVTGVAAGTATITATHTYTSGKTITATAVITVPA